ATASKAIDSKTKELMALAISIAVHCDGCVAYHTKMAHQHGATRDELSTYPKSERSKVQFQMNLKSALVLCAALRHVLATTRYRNDQIASHTIAPKSRLHSGGLQDNKYFDSGGTQKGF